MTGQSADFEFCARLEKKTNKLVDAGCQWMDFGTRRRFSYQTQSSVVDRMKGATGFLGTSNVHLALKHGVPAKGTSAHEMVMGLSALYGPRGANLAWLKIWSEHFQGLNGIALTDTFTTDVFLRDFGTYYARLFDGVRQDSGCPFEWGNKMITHYQLLGINSKSKTAVFSDGLDTDLFIRLTETFRNYFNVIGGIGTHLSNDVGVKPLNIVIKLIEADLGRGMKNVVKLSDNAGKHTGDVQEIALVKQELGIV
jgi:nicotinate phosphoribosyltransferase